MFNLTADHPAHQKTAVFQDSLINSTQRHNQQSTFSTGGGKDLHCTSSKFSRSTKTTSLEEILYIICRIISLRIYKKKETVTDDVPEIIDISWVGLLCNCSLNSLFHQGNGSSGICNLHCRLLLFQPNTSQLIFWSTQFYFLSVNFQSTSTCGAEKWFHFLFWYFLTTFESPFLSFVPQAPRRLHTVCCFLSDLAKASFGLVWWTCCKTYLKDDFLSHLCTVRSSKEDYLTG